MRGTDNRPANVIVAFVVGYLVGLPIACCAGVGLFDAAGRGNLGTTLFVLALLAGMLGPGLGAWWWNYRRRPPTDLRPWV